MCARPEADVDNTHPTSIYASGTCQLFGGDDGGALKGFRMSAKR